MSIALVVTVVLVMGVIFVNGWTDAPNAIATAVSTRVLKPNVAIWIAVVMNFLGALVMTYFNSQVAETISNIVSFEGGGNIQASQVALAIVVWSVAAWYFGIPTSESHALIAGLTGSAMALGGLGAVNGQEWIKVLIGLVVSTVFGFGGGYLLTKLIVLIFANVRRRTANKFFTIGQATAAAANAFLHGAQDGQKFMGVFMLGLFYNGLAEKSGNGFVFVNYGFWDFRGGYENYQIRGYGYGKIRALSRFLSGFKCGNLLVYRFCLWDSSFHDTYENNGDHGCGRFKTTFQCRLAHRERNDFRLGDDLPRLRLDCLCNGQAIYRNLLRSERHGTKETV